MLKKAKEQTKEELVAEIEKQHDEIHSLVNRELDMARCLKSTKANIEAIIQAESDRGRSHLVTTPLCAINANIIVCLGRLMGTIK